MKRLVALSLPIFVMLGGCTGVAKWANDDDNARVVSDAVKAKNYFDYQIYGTERLVQVFDNSVQTTVILPKGEKVVKVWMITKTGRIAQPVLQQGPYWIISGVNNQWKFDTTFGSVTVQRVESLPPEVVVQSDVKYIDRLRQEVYELQQQLAEQKRAKGDDIDAKK
jgi:hypothetical protein